MREDDSTIKPTTAASGGALTSDEVADARALLRASPLFADVPAEEIEATAHGLSLVRFASGEIIVRARELGDRCFILRSGQAQVLSDDLIGEEAHIATVGPGDIIGETALLKDVLRVATVRVVTPIEAYVLDRDTFLRLTESVPSFVGRLRRRVDSAERVRFLRRASPFAHLSDEVASELARTMRQVYVQAGEIVIREGERGDCFYLVRSGRLEVRRAGRQIGRQLGRRLRELTTGDYFGETALLTDTPRNATIRAREDCELLALRRPSFVELIAQHPTLRSHVIEMIRLRDGGDLEPVPSAPPRIVLPTQRGAFWLTLVIGLALFIALSEAAKSTGQPRVIQAVMVVGTLVGPVSYLVYLATANILTRQPLRLLVTFLIAAMALPLAVQGELAVGALGSDLVSAIAYAGIEEPVKVLGVVWLLRRADQRFQMDGIIYGAAAGMGFATIESFLYGLQKLSDVSLLVPDLWLRALMSPFTHGTWTAIICATIWRVKGSGPPRWDWRVLGAFAISIALHTAWDWSPFPGYRYYFYEAIGALGLAILGLFVRASLTEQAGAVERLNPELVGADPGGKRHQATCLSCGQVAPAGAHYCARCGVALRE